MIYLFINIKVMIHYFKKKLLTNQNINAYMVIKPRLTPPLPAVYKKIKCRFCIRR